MIEKRDWGETEIMGGRHAFRVRLLLGEVVSRGSPPARVLDAGCGDGSLTLELARRGFTVSSVDAAPGGLARLGRRDAAVCCARASLTALPFPDACFDAVVSGEVLEHIEDDSAAVAEFHRVLAPGAMAFVTVPANPGLFNIEDEWAGHIRRYTPEALRSLFENHGFITTDLHHWGWPVTYIYNRLLYPVWLKRQIKSAGPNPEIQTSFAGKGIVKQAMYYAFSMDRLFTRLPFGIGLVGVFQKAE